MVFSSMQRELESPPTANILSYHGSNSPMHRLCEGLCEGIHCVGVKTKTRSQLESLCSFLSFSRPVSTHACLFTVGSEGWLQLNISCVTLQDVHKVNMLYVPRQRSAGGHLGLYIRKAKEHSCGLGCFLETAPTKLGENVPSVTILHLFFCIFILVSVSSQLLLPGGLRAVSKK